MKIIKYAGDPQCGALRKFFSFIQPKPKIVIDQPMPTLLEMLSPNSGFKFDQFKSECQDLYEKERAIVKEVLKNVDANINLSVDVISSGRTGNENGSDYICLTAHFIDQEWILRRFILNFSPFGGMGNDSPGEIVLRCLREWEIEEKIWAVTTAKEILYDNMVKVLKENIVLTELHTSFFHVNCCADIVKKIVIKNAYESKREFLDKIKDMYPPKDAYLTWENINSHLLGVMFKVNAGETACEDWRNVFEIYELVEKVIEHVLPLYGKRYQSGNVYLYNLLEVLLYLDGIIRYSDRFKKDVAEKMLKTLDKYVKDMYFQLVTASVMDPRLKLKYIDSSSKKLDKSKISSVKSNTSPSKLISNLYDEYAAAYPIEENGPPEYCAPILLRTFTESQREEALKLSEIESYLAEPTLVWSNDFSPLSWWKNAGSHKYPKLSRMARDILSVPFTTAIGDEALLLEPRKAESIVASVEPAMANAIICIRNWLLNRNLALDKLLMEISSFCSNFEPGI